VRGLAPFAWRSLAARPARTLLTIVGIGLGVAVLAAALVTTAGIDDAVERTVTEVAGRADLTVSLRGRGLSPTSVPPPASSRASRSPPSIERRTYLAPDLSWRAAPRRRSPCWASTRCSTCGSATWSSCARRAARHDEPSALISETLRGDRPRRRRIESSSSGGGSPADAGRLRIVGIVRGDGRPSGRAGAWSSCRSPGAPASVSGAGRLTT
jgi:hypothetical protein